MIKFGTDGWRAKIAEEFTFGNVRLVTLALINFIRETAKGSNSIVIGYDNRFLSENFAMEAAKVASSAGFDTWVSKGSLPSPALSFAVKQFNAACGIMITASHNPPEYNGFKIKASFGGSASPEMTSQVERRLKMILEKKTPVEAGSEKNIRHFDPKKEYFEQLKKFVDLKSIKRADMKIIVDPMYGSASGYLKDILDEAGIASEEIRGIRDPLFGGANPEPLPHNLEELISVTREASLKEQKKMVVGLALDGDGDRIGAVGSNGDFISPHHIFAILLKHLVENKKMTGEVVKTFNITNLIPSMAKKYGLTLHETPIGFKYICELMLKRDILIGGEESGGIGIKGHIPERDSSLASLLLLEAAAAFKKPLEGLLEDIMSEFGHYYYNRSDLRLEEEKKLRVLNILRNDPPKSFASLSVKEVKTLDGIKFELMDNSWILFRASGTEPLLRIYCEATSPALLASILGRGEEIADKA